MKPHIPEPTFATEFEMQAELYAKLKNEGHKVRGEIRGYGASGKCQLDLVVFAGNEAACIIEVKNSPQLEILAGKHTRQSAKYAEFGIPVIYYTTAVRVEDVLAKVRAATWGPQLVAA